MKVAIFSSKRYERDFLNKHPHILEGVSNGDSHFEHLLPALNRTTASLAAGADAVCIFVNDNADAETVKILAKNGTKCLLLRCAGHNQVDLAAAENHGITVLRVPAYSPHAVAEFAAALLLTVVRKTHKAYNRTRESNFAIAGLMGFDLNGKTVGLCGTGKIGRLFAKIMLGFGTKVIAYDIYPSQEAKDMGVEYVSFDQVLAQSDVLSLHCPLLPTTKHMINKDAVEKMKDGIVLINSSRGELVDMDGLTYGLRSGKIGACGMDVVEGEEELFFDDHSGEILENEKLSVLLSFPNVVVTPHIAFCTDTAMKNIWSTTVGNIVDYVNMKGNEKLKNQVLLS